MGRSQFTRILVQERALYAAWRTDPNSLEGKKFRAPTEDGFIACARHIIEPGNTQRAVPEPRTDIPEDLVSPTMPVFAPMLPLPSSLSLSTPRRPLIPSGLTVPMTVEIPEQATLTAPNPFQPRYLCVPVILVDSVVHNFTQTPRFAVLGPHQPSMLWEGRVIKLANGDTHTVVLRRNHGASPQKPWCMVIEAEYEVAGLIFPRILLAANFLIHDTFIEEENPEPGYTGDGVAATVYDWLGFPYLGPTYGISATNYRRADSSDDRSEYEDTEEGSTSEDEGFDSA
ncbi:hypothetical protein DFH09DRAFT_1093957 [Mycena vulgaris]|nr:hypothetical protein DFH09DRAFT_1093957 [Mycena vulgaris]